MKIQTKSGSSAYPQSVGSSFLYSNRLCRLLLDHIRSGGRLELEGAGGQRRIGLHAGKADQRALAKAVQDVERRELLARKAHAHALELAFLALGAGQHPLQTVGVGGGLQREIGLER